MVGRSAMAASSEDLPSNTFGKWTWVSGDKKVKRPGVYGTMGVPAADNKPGGRMYAVGWVDKEDNLWLFGGHGYTDKKSERLLNDLWKFDGASWTWVSGDIKGNKLGVYGTKGVAAAGNHPGSRMGAVAWTDPEGNMWLFGGYGYATQNYAQLLDDLWKFDGSQWTWISGDCMKDRSGVYGTQRVANSANQPGARKDAVGWTGPQGNLWLYGGAGVDAYGNEGNLSDLWVFDGTNWIWVSGVEACNYGGVYGQQGVADVNNKPGARIESAAWTDNTGYLWLFGGSGVDGYGNYGQLNDLWKYDGNWTWVAGSPDYSTQFVSEATDIPSARNGSLCWYDAGGTLWLFGGSARTRSSDVSNDLWKFDGTNWTQVFVAAKHKERKGTYGTPGVSSGTDWPGARGSAVSWTDSKGTLWLFGGDGIGGYRNDLWKFEPNTAGGR